MDIRKENLELKMALALMVQQFYDWTIKPEEADNYNIEYNKDDEYISCYFHMFESAGENAWKMLGFDKPFISEKTLDELISNLENKLSALEFKPAKNLVRVCDEDDVCVDHDKDSWMYRVSTFADGHFQDEYWFRR